MQNKVEKLIWIDDLRAFAAVAVIVLHVSAPILYQYGTIPYSDWWVGHVFDSLVRFCVPVFLMLTGALLLGKTYTLRDFFKKRFSRIVYPFLFWTLIYIVYNLISESSKVAQLDATELCQTIYFQLKGGAAYHLWYIYLIIGIYLIIPVINKWIVKSSEREISYYLIIWLIVVLINLPVIDKYKPEVDLRYFTGYLGYPILGYLLSKKTPGRRMKWISFFLVFIGISITIVGTYLVTKNDGLFYEYYYSYLSPNVILASAGVFLFFRHAGIKTENKILKFISKYSYGVFLAHLFVLFMLAKIGISWSFINPLIGIPFTTLCCLILSLLLTYIINKIPLGSYVSG